MLFHVERRCPVRDPLFHVKHLDASPGAAAPGPFAEPGPEAGPEGWSRHQDIGAGAHAFGTGINTAASDRRQANDATRARRRPINSMASAPLLTAPSDLTDPTAPPIDDTID
ncbi:hypothetical protein [Cellulomonas sp. KRMCY2]|uniref:hypothetical protein n=1 Tax=Cellulomonas sp. KRMCY2 TaxID=1304865 RepID=UPI0012DC599D|nr:hypothetical protein [Cellulomonas sp. KRMCY2]